MKLISVILNEIMDVDLNNPIEDVQHYRYKEIMNAGGTQGLPRTIKYEFVTATKEDYNEMSNKEFGVDFDKLESEEQKKLVKDKVRGNSLVYNIIFNQSISTRGKIPPMFVLSFNVPTKTVDDEDQYKTKAAKGDAGNRSFDTLTNEQDSKVLNTVVLITHKLIEQFNKDYPVKDGGYAITWEGTFGPEYSDDAGQSSKDSRENIYKYAVYKFKRHHKNLEVVDDKESPTKNIQLRFNGWSSDEKKFL